MIKAISFLGILISSAVAFGQATSGLPAPGVQSVYSNASVTGTTVNTLTKLTGAPSTAASGCHNLNVTLSNALTMNNGGSGAASGTTFNGSAAQTISYNTIGAPGVSGTFTSGNCIKAAGANLYGVQ